jgi:Fe-S cluster assembly protein SufD
MTPTSITVDAQNQTHQYTVEKSSTQNHVMTITAMENLNSEIEFNLQDNAILNLLVIQEGAESANNAVKHTFKLAQDSQLNVTWLSRQNKEISQHIQLDFNGEGINANLSGLASLKGSQKITTHTQLNHHSPNTNASQHFKNIIADEAVAEYQGLVHVKAEAQKTDSNQYTHNLILSDHGRAYTKPQLEIFADDVKCSHGASIGQLNEEHIFYLNSRGFSKHQAREILLTGFAEEIIDLIPVPMDKEALLVKFL